MPFQNFWVFLFRSRKLYPFSLPVRVIKGVEASPQVLAYWQSMQSRRVIEAIKWLGFPMYWHPGTRRIFVG